MERFVDLLAAHYLEPPPPPSPPIPMPRIIATRQLPLGITSNHPQATAIHVKFSSFAETFQGVVVKEESNPPSPRPPCNGTLAIIINWVQRMGQILRHGEKELQIVW